MCCGRVPTIDEEGKGEEGDVDDCHVGPGGDVGAAQTTVGGVDAHTQRDQEGVQVDVGACRQIAGAQCPVWLAV